MNTRNRLTFRVALASALVVACVAAAHAAPPQARRTARPMKPVRTFSTSAEYSGILGRSLVVEGVLYRLAPNATVYVVGEGMKTSDLVLANASIYLSGEMRREGPLVQSIIVRPNSAGAHTLGDSRNVGVVPEGAPF